MTPLTPRAERTSWRGLACTRLALPNGDSVRVADFGAQLLSWQAQGSERLFVSDQARLDGTAPIRGGVPVCFPQFNARGPLPKHGLARRATWAWAGFTLAQDGAGLAARWQWQPPAPLHPDFAHAVQASLLVTLAPDALSVELQARNPGRTAWAFTGALHTYLAVHDADSCRLQGLEGQAFWDAAQGFAPAVQHGPVALGAEVDRVYGRSPQALALHSGGAVLEITQDAAWPETVVWNPGPALCAQLPDLAPDSWRHMLCVEAAAINQPVALLPGQQWQAAQHLRLR